MYYIKSFDPWKSNLCTCPEKYSFNPYTGCDHKCIYCYSTSYIPNFYNLRLKKDLIKKVRADIKKIPRDSLISISNTSDPYPKIEAQLGLTRKSLEIFKEMGFRVLIITKGTIVTRDADLLGDMKAAVTITITTLTQETCKKLEPSAPLPEDRINALKILSDANVPLGIRLDPVFPFINEKEIGEIVYRVSDYADHIVSSTFKPRYDSLKRFNNAFPDFARIQDLFLKKGRVYYLAKDIRRELMLKVRDACNDYGLTFASCREGFNDLNTAKTCDGSHLIDSVD
ncbi:MAG: radical SAM protein [Candidatus Hydrothermarchaeota archaeon]